MRIEASELSGKQRIGWIDIAKGMAIALVIYGHSMDYTYPARPYVFSFHMPLFFILAGYTFRPQPWKVLVTKSVKRLCLTYTALFVLWQIPNLLMTTDHIGRAVLWDYFLTFVYASGVELSSMGISSVGMPWFLICLFAARVMFNGICKCAERVQHPTLLSGIASIAVLAAGVSLGNNGFYLPLSLDVAFVATFFMWCGYAAKAHMDMDMALKLRFGVAAAALWLLCCQFSILELAARNYQNAPVAIIAALSGTYMVCCISKLLDRSDLPLPLKPVHALLRYAGENSLSIYCIHSIDWWVSWLSLPSLSSCALCSEITAVLRMGYAIVFSKLAKTF